MVLKVNVLCAEKWCYVTAPAIVSDARPPVRHGNFAAAARAVMLLQASAIRAAQVELEEVAAFPTQQVSGVAVSPRDESSSTSLSGADVPHHLRC
jgi:hypothetical protein